MAADVLLILLVAVHLGVLTWSLSRHIAQYIKPAPMRQRFISLRQTVADYLQRLRVKLQGALARLLRRGSHRDGDEEQQRQLPANTWINAVFRASGRRQAAAAAKDVEDAVPSFNTFSKISAAKDAPMSPDDLYRSLPSSPRPHSPQSALRSSLRLNLDGVRDGGMRASSTGGQGVRSPGPVGEGVRHSSPRGAPFHTQTRLRDGDSSSEDGGDARNDDANSVIHLSDSDLDSHDSSPRDSGVVTPRLISMTEVASMLASHHASTTLRTALTNSRRASVCTPEGTARGEVPLISATFLVGL